MLWIRKTFKGGNVMLNRRTVVLFLAIFALLVFSSDSASGQQASLKIDYSGCPTIVNPPDCHFRGDWTLEKSVNQSLLIHPNLKSFIFEVKVTENKAKRILKNHGTIVIVNSGDLSAGLTSILLNLQLEDSDNPGGSPENSWETVRNAIANEALFCIQNNMAETCFGVFVGSPDCNLTLYDYSTGDPINLADIPPVPFTQDPVCENATKIKFEGEFDISDSTFDKLDQVRFEMLVTFNGRTGSGCTADVNCNRAIDSDDPATPMVNESEAGIGTVALRQTFSFPVCADTLCTEATFSDSGAFSSGEDCIELTSGFLLDCLSFRGSPGTEYNYQFPGTVSCHQKPCTTYIKNKAILEVPNCDLIFTASDSFAVQCTTIQTGTSEEELKKTVKDFMLLGNYPNPFNPYTEISYFLAENARVKVEIYNLRGQKVITLLDKWQTEGLKTIRWNGKDLSGKRVSSGVYFYRVQVNDKSETKKMALIK